MAVRRDAGGPDRACAARCRLCRLQAGPFSPALLHQNHGSMRVRQRDIEFRRHAYRASDVPDARHGLVAQSRTAFAEPAARIGQTTGLPSRATLSDYLSTLGLEGEFGDFLWLPVSRAHDNALAAPMARYFVIHDTSGPNFGRRSFPDDIDGGGKVNDLRNFECHDGWGKAHVVISRTGELLLAHDYSIPWRETKFEQAAEFGGALKGLFLHNEMIQPRRSAPGRGRRNDARSPDPAFTPAQYDRLALLYVIASVRAERWLIPAFHAAIDAQIANGHDDPLNFNVESFADSLDGLIAKLGTPDQVQAAHQ